MALRRLGIPLTRICLLFILVGILKHLFSTRNHELKYHTAQITPTPTLSLPTLNSKVDLVFFIFQEVCPRHLWYPHDRVSGVLLLDVIDTECLQHLDLNVQAANCQQEKSCVIEYLEHIPLASSPLDGKVVFCVDCELWLLSSLRKFTFSLIKPSKKDFDQMIWLEAISPTELRSWEKVSFEISVITTCRMKTLRNLMDALLHATFLGDNVDLQVSVDSNASSECLQFIESFQWNHGGYHVRRRIRSAGGAQIAVPEGLGATGPDGHYGILLEDDVLVSSEFYAWLKFAGLQVQQTAQKYSQKIFSISLYTPRVIETGRKRREWIKYEDLNILRGSAYLYEVPCSWGSAFSSTHWSKALSYFEARLSGEEKYNPIENSRVNGWTGSWKKWLIELGYYEHWTTLYPLFEEERSFSTNLLQKGQHIIEPQNSDVEMYVVPLFEDNSWYSQLRNKRLFPKERSFDLHFTPVT
jgi:hypothetical protein